MSAMPGAADEALPPRPAPSIRARLLRGLLPLLILVLVAASIIDYRTSIAPVEAAYDQSLADAALAVSAQLRLEEQRVRVDLTDQSISMLRVDTDDQVFFRVIGPGGQTVAGDAGLYGPQVRQGREYFETRYRGQRVRGIASVALTPLGPSVVLVAETTRKRDRARREVVTAHVASVLSVVILTLLVVWFATETALRPVERIADEVRTRSPSELQPLPVETAPREVQPLLEALNRLFVRIRETQDSQRRFVENAAHQLRTPLAGLKGQVDLALGDSREAFAGVEGPAAERLRARLERIQQASERITHLANQMLTLARSDRASHVAASRQVVGLEELVVDAVAAHIDAAIARDHDLGAETVPVSVGAVAWELRELLANLIDNAIRYTPSGGRITVRCGLQGAGAFLEVEDSGPGIAEGERERVFERFYRPAAASSGGSGLGLAIVRDIASLYGGGVSIADAPGGTGTVVRVLLPAAVTTPSEAPPGDA